MSQPTSRSELVARLLDVAVGITRGTAKKKATADELRAIADLIDPGRVQRVKDAIARLAEDPQATDEALALLKAEQEAKRLGRLEFVTHPDLTDVPKEVLTDSGEALAKAQREEKRAKKAAEQRAIAKRVVEHWVKRLHPGAKVTEDRIKKVQARIREGFTEITLMRAVDGCAASDFHQGENKAGKVWDDIGLIFRDAAHVEKFAAEGREAAGSELDESDPGIALAVQALQTKATKLLKAGKQEEYEKVQQKLRTLQGARVRSDP